MRFAAAGLLLAISLLVAASTVAAAATISVTVSDGSTSVDESGTTDTFDVVLSEQPAISAVVSLSSSDPGEVTVSPATLTFTTNSNNPTTTANRDQHEALVASPRPEDETIVPFEPKKSAESCSDQGDCVERTTGFEPATLTLAR